MHVVTAAALGTSPVNDDSTGAMFVEDADIFHTHEGKAYIFTTRITVASGGTGYVQLLTGTSVIHLRQYTLTCSSSPAYLSLMEAATTSAAGTAVAVNNMNRGSSNTSLATVTNGPTVTNAGTAIDDDLIPGSRQDGGFGRHAPKEFMLLPSTKYLFRINNTSNGSADCVLRGFWVEI